MASESEGGLLGKPVLLAVDDDPLVLAAVQRDLRRQYANEYLVVGSASGAAAREVVDEVVRRGDVVALFLVDQRMPVQTGVEFLESMMEIQPDAKRILLTAYADTDAAIAAINRARLDYYILKPWEPAEERLYPILDDLLNDWLAGYRPSFDGIRLISDRWSKESHLLKEFLAHNQVPYRSHDVESDPEAGRLLASLDVDGPTPLVLFPDGTYLIQPTGSQVAERLGMNTRPGLQSYDLVIVGGGPAGLAAAVYGSSEGLSTVLLEREGPGGQAGESARIENYLGFPVGLSGADLARRALTQARRFGAEILVPAQASALTLNDPYRIVHLDDGTEISCRAIVIATGVSYRRLPVPGEEELAGSGLYYGASRGEAHSYRGENVVIVGSGNSAGQAAVYLAGFAETVNILVRSASLTESMSQYLIDQLASIDNVSIRFQTGVTGLEGEGHLRAVEIEDLNDHGRTTLPAAAAFVFIGQAPHTEWVADVLERDEQGFIVTGSDCSAPVGPGWFLDRARLPLESSIPGVFVAGDVRRGSIKRVASAAGEGSVAVRFVHEHLAQL